MSEVFSIDAVRVRYKEACAERDAIEKKVAPLRSKLTKAAEEAEAYRVKAMKVAEELNAARGGASWFVLKKEIGRLAKVISAFGGDK